MKDTHWFDDEMKNMKSELICASNYEKLIWKFDNNTMMCLNAKKED